MAGKQTVLRALNTLGVTTTRFSKRVLTRECVLRPVRVPGLLREAVLLSSQLLELLVKLEAQVLRMRLRPVGVVSSRLLPRL